MFLAHYEIKFKKYNLCNQSVLFNILNFKKALKCLWIVRPIKGVFGSFLCASYCAGLP